MAMVDKAKMVFHYVAKIKEAPEGSTREMKVCFRHSKHSIKCDINAPCPECDAGLKLYSHDQCRRHLDVVRAERRFESIEVDRAENLIERLAELDENGKRALQLLDALNTRLDAPQEEERTWRETTCCALKELSRNTLRALKKTEELADGLRALCEGPLGAEMTSLGAESRRQTSLLERSLETSERVATSSESASKELTALKCVLRPLEGALRSQSEALALRLSSEAELMRREAEERVTRAVEAVVSEVRTVADASRELRDGLPERLVDAFGGLLLLSQDKEEERGRGVEL